LLDVREKEHFDVASIPGAINVPFSTFQAKSKSTSNGEIPHPNWLPKDVALDVPVYVVCRVGNDSQLVTRKLKDMGFDRNGERFIGDIKGGMKAWKREVDQTMPFT
jgi:adenylyltransferase/sulfurtransferase